VGAAKIFGALVPLNEMTMPSMPPP